MQHHLALQLDQLGVDVDLWSVDLPALRAHPDFPGSEAPRDEAWLHKVAQHADYADTLQLLSLGLGVATILLLSQVRSKGGDRLPRWAPNVLVAVVVVLSGLNLVYSYLAGDSGAKLVWTEVL